MQKTIPLLVALALTLGVSGKAQAQNTSSFDVDWTRDGLVAGAAFAGTLLMMLTPVDLDDTWESEVLGSLDERVKANFSRNAAHLSDALIAGTIVAPLVLMADDGFDKADGKRALVYGQTLGVSLLANSVTKYLVQRPRPYVYNPHTKAQSYREKAGKDAQLSFYSGHASTAFSAATAGSYLFAASSDNRNARLAVWASSMAMASSTAILRVRAGKHFYSDIFVGSLVGAGIGVLVPALHQTGERYKPSGAELGAMALGVGLGSLGAYLLPFESLGNAELAGLGLGNLRVGPSANAHGAGIALTGSIF